MGWLRWAQTTLEGRLSNMAGSCAAALAEARKQHMEDEEAARARHATVLTEAKKVMNAECATQMAAAERR
eukprot:SAG11_NODE_12088_length_722_cov_1.365971_2_plen_70_part_00